MKKGATHSGSPRKKPPHPNFRKNLSEYFCDYSSNTSIQGIKYLGEKNRSLFEKLFWLVFLSVSIYFCGYLINSVYCKWRNAPVLVTFSNNLIPVWEIPFPAVTVCPQSKARTNLYNYTNIYNKFQDEPNNLTEEELKYFEQMNFLCGYDTSLPNGSKTLGNDTIDFLFDVAPPYDEWVCFWRKTRNHCMTLMTTTLTDEGVCRTFNMLDREELFTSKVYYNKNMFKHGITSTNWSLENGYAKDVGTDDYPRRTSAGSLIFTIAIPSYEPELDYGCREAVHGYMILLHHPAEIPGMHQMAFMASFDKHIIVTIKPEQMTTSLDLETYDPEQRQCYFSYERKLKYFQVYTQSNCELECLTNYTLERCGCVSFYMPRYITTNICGRANYICMNTANNIMVRREMKMENYMNETRERCNCLPACTSLTYSTETSEVENKWKKWFYARNIPEDVTGYSLTKILFFFKVQYVITTERKELYGLTDFIANCGGLLGLFLGFSFLSLVEIIYFLTIRLICNVKTHGVRLWSGSLHIDSDSPDSPKQTSKAISNPPFKNKTPQKHDLIVTNLE